MHKARACKLGRQLCAQYPFHDAAPTKWAEPTRAFHVKARRDAALARRIRIKHAMKHGRARLHDYHGPFRAQYGRCTSSWLVVKYFITPRHAQLSFAHETVRSRRKTPLRPIARDGDEWKSCTRAITASLI
jgi:hypothetical protein